MCIVTCEWSLSLSQLFSIRFVYGIQGRVERRAGRHAAAIAVAVTIAAAATIAATGDLGPDFSDGNLGPNNGPDFSDGKLRPVQAKSWPEHAFSGKCVFKANA